MFILTTVDKAGTKQAIQYDEFYAAEQNWALQVQRVKSEELAGIGLEEQMPDGSKKPLKAVYSQNEDDADLFIRTIKTT